MILGQKNSNISIYGAKIDLSSNLIPKILTSPSLSKKRKREVTMAATCMLPLPSARAVEPGYPRCTTVLKVLTYIA
jgi:hypothetical protein